VDRIVVISGANRGIGREAARQFVERRDTVVVTARRADQASEAAAELNSTAEFERAVARRLDVTDQESIVDLAADLPDGGPTGGFFRDGKPLPW
jgi:NAD(P)-dependent dehydrogenase (short-subunit alcohol dehydrogenase family)